MLVPFLMAIYILGMGMALMHGWDNQLCDRNDPAEVIVYQLFNIVMALLWPVMILIALLMMLYQKLPESWRL